MKKVFYFDVETTGLDYKENEIIQLAYIMEIDGVIAVENNLFITPVNEFMIDKKVLDIVGRTEKEIYSGMKPDEAYRLLINDFELCANQYDKTDKFYPAGYNVDFDLRFLAEFFEDNNDEYLGSWLNWKQLDPLCIMRILDYQGRLSLENLKLETVCKHYKIELDPHDAMSDIKATRLLFKKFMKE